MVGVGVVVVSVVEQVRFFSVVAKKAGLLEHSNWPFSDAAVLSAIWLAWLSTGFIACIF